MRYKGRPSSRRGTQSENQILLLCQCTMTRKHVFSESFRAWDSARYSLMPAHGSKSLNPAKGGAKSTDTTHISEDEGLRGRNCTE